MNVDILFFVVIFFILIIGEYIKKQESKEQKTTEKTNAKISLVKNDTLNKEKNECGIQGKKIERNIKLPPASCSEKKVRDEIDVANKNVKLEFEKDYAKKIKNYVKENCIFLDTNFLPYYDRAISLGEYVPKSHGGSSEWSDNIICLKEIEQNEDEEKSKLLFSTVSDIIIKTTQKYFNNVFYVYPVPPSNIDNYYRETVFGVNDRFAKLIAGKLKMHYAKEKIVKIQSNEKFVFLTREKRKEVLAIKNFKVKQSFNQKNILIIDDVTTTGHTLNTIGQKLKEAGAGSLFAITLGYTKLNY